MWFFELICKIRGKHKPVTQGKIIYCRICGKIMGDESPIKKPVETDSDKKEQAWIKVSDVSVEWPTGKFDFGESRIRVHCNIISSSGEYPRLFANDPHHNLDVFSVGGKSLGLKLYNKSINFTSGERRNDKPPDHYGIFRVNNFKGQHTCEVCMSFSRSQAWVLWDGNEVARWDIAIIGGTKPIGKIECGGTEYKTG